MNLGDLFRKGFSFSIKRKFGGPDKSAKRGKCSVCGVPFGEHMTLNHKFTEDTRK